MHRFLPLLCAGMAVLYAVGIPVHLRAARAFVDAAHLPRETVGATFHRYREPVQVTRVYQGRELYLFQQFDSMVFHAVLGGMWTLAAVVSYLVSKRLERLWKHIEELEANKAS